MLKWVFGADTSPFRRSLNEMRSDVKQFSASAKSQLVGLFGAGAITAWVSATLDAAGRIDDLSKRLDMSAESFQRLSYASKLSGGDMEVVGKSLTILTKNLEEAKKGGDGFADAAAALNVNLEELAGMDPEGKMIELARGYAQSTDKGAALSAIMKLLGKSGAEIIPMLTDGPEALAEMMGEATVATNEQIETMAKIGDAIDALKSKSVSWLGNVIDGLKIAGAYLEWFLNKSLGSGEVADAQLEKSFDSIIHGDPSKADAKAKAEAAAQSAKEQLETEKERKKLGEDIAKLEEDARIRALSLTEKILDAEKRRSELAADAIFGEDETKSLEARKKQLEVEKEIAGYREEQATNDKELDDKRKKSAEEIKTLTEKGAELDRSNKLAGMDDREKREFLKKERAQAIKDAADKTASGDAKGGLELSNKAKQLTGEIDDITRGLNDDLQKKLADAQKAVPSISTSSLADIGGGGGARLMDNDQSRRMVDLLAQIAANTAGGSEGSKPPEPI
jgi:hypothetical protein